MPIKYLTVAEREQEVTFTAKNRIKFRSRRDLYNGIEIILPDGFKENNLPSTQFALIAEATAEMVGMFMLETYPVLQGHSGLDCLRFDA